jgi:hypothetical protein
MSPTLVFALALLSYVTSLLAIRVARQAQRASAAATAAAGPAPPPAVFRVDVLEGQARRTLSDDSRDYALLVSFTNDTAEQVVVSGCVLRVTYRTRANFLGAVDLEPRTDVELSKMDARPVFHSTVTVNERQQAQRWLLFHTVNVVPRHCRVQEYAIVVTTGEGRRYLVDASLPSMLAADTDGEGPATWGWD